MIKRKIYDEIVTAFENKYLGLGREVGEEFLLTAASWSIQEYNEPDFRVRRHLLLFWEAGWMKSSMLCKMYEILGTDNCIYTSDLSLASLRGSVDYGKFVVPACMKKPFSIATEFGQISGSDNQELVQKLLNVLEEGIVTVSLVKIGQLNPQDRERIQTEYKVQFLDDNTFTYRTNWTLLAGTYNKKFLSDNALESRFNIISPRDQLTPALVKHVNESGPFDLSEEAVWSFRDILKKKQDIEMKIKLPEEVYELKMTMRDCSQIVSHIMGKQWWGVTMKKDDIYELAKKYQKNSLDVWTSSKDKVFDCLSDGEPRSIDEIEKDTGLIKRTVYYAIKDLGLQALRDENGKKVYTLK